MNRWILAARPKTLLVSVAPVIVAISLAPTIQILPAAICLLFAVLAQIISNFANDYADFLKGADDEDRLGPKRTLSSGLISKKDMEHALLILTALTALLGLSLIRWGGWILLPVGLLIFIGAYSYSAGPYPLSYHGLGDLAVVLFYGFVPVVFTYYVLCGAISLNACLAGTAIGLVADNLLIVNNYRDAEQDRKHGKRTSVVIFGKKAARAVFLLNPLAAAAIGFCFIPNKALWAALISCFLIFAFLLWRRLRASEGAALNSLLPKASLLSIIYAAFILLASII